MYITKLKIMEFYSFNEQTDVRGRSVCLSSLTCSNVNNALCSVMDYRTLV